MSQSFPDNAEPQPAWRPASALEQEPERQSGLVQWWYRVTAPPPAPASASFVRREASRKARLLSTVSFFFLLVLLMFLPASFLMPPIIPVAVVFAMFATFIAIFVNRAGQTTAAGIIIVLGAEIALGGAILLMPPLRPADIQLYDLYALIILLAVSLLPPRYVFLFALAHSIFIGVDIPLHSHTQALAQDLQTQLIPAIVRPVSLQLLGGGVAYIWVNSATRAIIRADRAEMVAALEHTIAEQRASIEQEKQELDESIQQLIQAHVAASNGQISSRIPYPPAKVLWPLVGAINSLWARLQRTQQVEHDYQQLQQAISYYIRSIQQSASTGQPRLPLLRTGTSLDQLMLAIRTLYSGGHAQPGQSHPGFQSDPQQY